MGFPGTTVVCPAYGEVTNLIKLSPSHFPNITAERSMEQFQIVKSFYDVAVLQSIVSRPVGDARTI